jgi:hypothetical protein
LYLDRVPVASAAHPFRGEEVRACIGPPSVSRPRAASLTRIHAPRVQCPPLEDITMHPIRNPSRRDFCRLTAAPACTLSHPHFFLAAQQPATEAKPKSLSPDESLRELLAGNQRFVKGQTLNPRRSPADFSPLAKAQYTRRRHHHLLRFPRLSGNPV